MSEKPRAKAGATPGKLAIVGVLALALVGIIWKNFSGGSGEKLTPRVDKERPALAASNVAAPPAPSGAATNTAGTPVSAGAAAASGVDPFGDFAVDQSWPEPALSDVIKHDPLAAGSWAGAHTESPEDEALTEKRINELMASKNAIIFMTGNNRVARIGTQEFRVGDTLGRYKISEITSQGVVLSER
jgi:hypothetical protein